jgi:metal-sulfur cluster biosynthetic enzyme
MIVLGYWSKEGISMDEKVVWSALKTVIDPELGINIVDLGLVYTVEILSQSGGIKQTESVKDGKAQVVSPSVLASDTKKVAVQVTMTLTTPGCPLGGYFLEQVAAAVAGAVGIGTDQVQVQIVFDPPWTTDMMNAEALAELGWE